MKNIYLKFFIIGFLIVFFLNLISFNYENYILIKSTILGIFSGLFLSILPLIHKFIFLRKGIKNEDIFKTTYEEDFLIDLNFSDFKNFLKNDYSKYKVKLIEETDYSLTFKTNISLKTLGTKIFIKFIEGKDNKNLIKIKVSPFFKTTLIDYGASYEEFKKIKNLIQETFKTN